MKICRKDEAHLIFNPEAGSSLGEIVGNSAPILNHSYSVAFTQLAIHGFVEPHVHHHTDELYIFTKGSCIMKINNQEIMLDEGTTLVIEPNEWHELLPCTEEVSFYAISFPAFDPDDYITDGGK